MSKPASWLMLSALLSLGLVIYAQAPTGTIVGTVTDESGAVIPSVTVTITNKATGVARHASTNASGLYSAPALEAGEYQVRVEVTGFRTLLRDATVSAGNDTTVNATMSLGESKEVVTVEAATAQINYDTHNIQGVISHETIQDLPLNGRSFLQLAAIEPGVTITSGSVAQFNSLFSVSVLGAGNRTVITMDGGNVSDNVTVGGGMTSMNFSQDMIQEFQLSTVNFDLATPIAVGGALNVVTRSGSNDFHGSGYFYFRDHNMAAYPNLKRLPGIPDPFFARRNPGFWIGGPVIKDKLFFFFNYEYMNQVQAISIQTTAPTLQGLQGTYGSPYKGKQFSLRADYHINSKETLFVRYSHDGNSGRGQSLLSGDPSSWTDNVNWADQSIIGLTSALTPTLVNDFRGQYNYWNNKNGQAVASDCSLPCVAGPAGGLPTVYTIVGTNLPALGPNFNAPQGRNTRRYEVTDSLSWEKGSHRMKFGGNVNLTKTNGIWGFCLPMCVGAWSKEFLVNTFGAATAALIAPNAQYNFKSDADILNLPVYNGNASIFSGIGVGAIPTPSPYGYDENRHANQYRIFVQDVWKVRPNFTVNYGLAWNAQTGFYNGDIPKPQYLTPILGANNLGATPNNVREFQPAFGFAWSINNKTVIRGGGGIYWDAIPYYWKLREAASIGPPGNGRSTLSAAAFTNTYPNIINFLTGQPLPIGAPLGIGGLYNMSIAQFMALVNQELPAIAAKLAPPNPQRSGPFSVSGLDIEKSGVEIFPSSFPMPRSYQTSLGIQRDIGHGIVVSADWARRQGENTWLSEVDLNLFNRFQGSSTPVPVIPLCTPSQVYVAGIECSNGAITFWENQGRAIYEGLLIKANKRMANHLSFTASYAFQHATTTTVVDDTKWFRGYGEYLPHHDLNVAIVSDLPWGFTLSINNSFISRTPMTASVSNLFLPGTVPAGSSFPLPGLAYGSLNAGTSKSDLTNLVNTFNTTIAGTKDAKGVPIKPLALPPDYQFGDPFFTTDLRLTKAVTFKERYKLNVFGEMFNAFNIANLTGYGFTLDNQAATQALQTYAFGQPTQRINQTFGSGGPRAIQVGARFIF